MARTRIAVTLVLALAITAAACAARSPRDTARVGALSIGEAVLALDAAEQAIAQAQIPGYGQVEQARVNAGVLKVLYAARAYERAVAQWPEAGPAPAQVEQARVGVTRALDDLVAALPAVSQAREPILRAVNVLRAALTPTSQAQTVPPIGPINLLALINLAANLILSGRSSWTRIKAAFAKEGATDEELAALDDRLSAAIARREGTR